MTRDQITAAVAPIKTLPDLRLATGETAAGFSFPWLDALQSVEAKAKGK